MNCLLLKQERLYEEWVSRRNREFSFAYVRFDMLVRHPNGDVKKSTGCEIEGRIKTGDANFGVPHVYIIFIAMKII